MLSMKFSIHVSESKKASILSFQRVLSQTTKQNDKTIGLKALLGMLLAFWQFCQGLCLNDKKVGMVRRGVYEYKNNERGSNTIYDKTIYILLFINIYYPLQPYITGFGVLSGKSDKSVTKLKLL